MAQLIIPGAAQVVVKAECSGQVVINVIGLIVPSGASAQSIAEAVKTAWELPNGPLALRPIQLKMVSYKATRLEADGAIAETMSTKAGGSSASQLSTMASSGLIMLGGGTRDRSGRGRLYHGPLHEGQIDADGRTISGSTATSLTQAYGIFRGSIEASGFSWAVLSRKNSRATRIEQSTCASIIATQRRRQR